MNKHLTIFQINDVHGYVDIHPELFLENGQQQSRYVGGYARIATLIKQEKELHPNHVITLDNGDTFHGTYHVVNSKGEDLIPILNEINIDAMTAHWDFAYGPAQFKKLVSQLNYPMLANNCYVNETNELLFPPYKVFERAGVKIGVIGIAATIIDKVMPPHFSEGVYFTLGNEELPELIHHLRENEQADLIIVLSHLGFPHEVKLANEVDGIDILLSGHTHNRLAEPVVENNTIIIQSGCHGSFIGRLDILLADGKILNYEHELVEVSENIDPDPHVEKLVTNMLSQDEAMLNKVVGKTETTLDRYGTLETTMDNLLLEAITHTSGAQLAFSNGWRYGVPILPGPITMNHLWNIIPTNPPVSTVEITGKELLMMLEENLERTFASDPYEQMGGYVKRCLGMQMYVKLENPEGTRIQQLFIDGEMVELDKVYQAVFVTEQGVPDKYGTNRKNLNIHAIEALYNYIKLNEPLTIQLRGTVKVV